MRLESKSLAISISTVDLLTSHLTRHNLNVPDLNATCLQTPTEFFNTRTNFFDPGWTWGRDIKYSWSYSKPFKCYAMSICIARHYASVWPRHPLTVNCMWTGDALNGFLGLREAFRVSFPHEICPLPSDTCISPGIECQRMSAGLLHMWLAFLSCSLSLPQLPPPAPLWKPRLTEPSLAPSSLSDTRSISCVPRASNWLARQHAFAETTAPGVASTPPAKVSVTQGFVDRLGVTLETHIHLTRN